MESWQCETPWEPNPISFQVAGDFLQFRCCVPMSYEPHPPFCRTPGSNREIRDKWSRKRVTLTRLAYLPGAKVLKSAFRFTSSSILPSPSELQKERALHSYVGLAKCTAFVFHFYNNAGLVHIQENFEIKIRTQKEKARQGPYTQITIGIHSSFNIFLI